MSGGRRGQTSSAQRASHECVTKVDLKRLHADENKHEQPEQQRFAAARGDQGKASAATHIDTPVLVGHDGHSVGLAQSDGGVVALVPVIVLENLKQRKCDKVEGA